MKYIYQSFTEAADRFVDGNMATHVLSPHTDDECLVWQRAIREFATWLDGHEGVKLELTE